MRVDPVDLAGRTADDLVARGEFDFTKLLAQGQQVDLSTLQVHKYDAATGKPEPFRQFDSATSPYDRPCRFEDNKAPVDFPDRDGAASDRPDGRAVRKIRKRAARLFNREMDNKAGHLVWVHTQRGDQPSYYAIYFQVRPVEAEVGPSPAPWIGDVDVLRRPTGQSLGGLAHFCAGAGDFNGDGLFDFFAGAEKGHVMFFANRGTRGHPKFVGCQLLPDELGPIDCGWYSAPSVYDWDDDGLPDLLVGTMHNTILWWKNTGTTTEPALTYKGFIQADGKQLASPESPIAEDHAGIWKHDYYIQPAVCDFNGDGLPDILTGSYTTGRISCFLCTGRDAHRVPILTNAGLVKADGEPIDTCWAAAPTAYDFDQDGKLELITGSWNFQGSTRPVDYLLYYENVGTKTKPRYQHRPFPKIGDFPTGSIARASVVDWDDDGRMDLLVSDNGGAIRVFLNEGTATHPRWRMNNDSLTAPWCFAKMPSTHFSGMRDADGKHEFISGRTIATLGGSPYSPAIEIQGSAQVDGKPLTHPGPGYGDPYNLNVLYDWDKDGHSDILCGTHQGNIFFHRRLGTGECSFAPGVKLKLTTGDDLKVGPPVWDDPKSVRDFIDLQGSRINVAPADYDGDGIDDLVVTETYSNIWVFLNTVSGGTNTFKPGIKVGKTLNRYRGRPHAFDWNKDGKPDLLSGLTVDRPGTVYVNQSTKGKPAFADPIHPFDLPYVFFGAIMYGLDWNSDGDEDFLIHSEFYEFWAERSFIENGYRPAVPANAASRSHDRFQVETRPDTPAKP